MNNLITPEYAEEMVRQHATSKTWGGSVDKYGSGDILGLITGRPYIKTVLDYGAGKQKLTDYLTIKAPHVSVTSYDPGIPGIDALPTGKFDIVISCDVLEHVEREYTEETIQRLWDYTKVVMFNNIACASDLHIFQYGPYVGKDRHLVQRPSLWWRQKFDDINDPKMSLMEYRCIERRHQLGVRERCVLIHERIG